MIENIRIPVHKTLIQHTRLSLSLCYNQRARKIIPLMSRRSLWSRSTIPSCTMVTVEAALQYSSCMSTPSCNMLLGETRRQVGLSRPSSSQYPGIISSGGTTCPRSSSSRRRSASAPIYERTVMADMSHSDILICLLPVGAA